MTQTPFPVLKMRRLVVEPHADDAFLSLGAHIEQWTKDSDEVRIMTVLATPKRAEESKAYAHAVGAHHYLVFSEEKPHDKPLTDDALSHLAEFITLQQADVLYLPLGIKHPEHLAVASLAARSYPIAHRYFDIPYVTVQRNGEELLARAAGLTLISVMSPPKKKWRHVPLFKSQARFFFNNMPPSGTRMMTAPEIIVTNIRRPKDI